MTDVKRLLEQYHFNILKDMARLLGSSTASNKKVDYVRILSSILFTPAAIKKGIARLGKREKEALAAIQRAGGRIQANRLRLQLLRRGVVEATGKRGAYYAPYTSKVLLPEQHRTTFQAVVGRLIAAGVVCGEGMVEISYSIRTKIYYDNVETLYIPDSVQPALPDQPTAVDTQQVRPEHLVRIDEGSARAFQRDVYFYWSTVRANPLTLTKQDRLYKKDLRIVNNALLKPQPIKHENEPRLPRLLFLRLLLTDLGLLKKGTEGREWAKVIRAVDRPQFLAQQPVQRIDHTFKHWRDGRFWNEILSIPGTTIVEGCSRLETAPRQLISARKRVLFHISELHRTTSRAKLGQKSPPGRDKSRDIVPASEGWVSIEQLLGQIRSRDYDFLLPRDYRPSRSTYYHAYYGYTSLSRSPYISYGNAMGWSFSPALQDEAEGWEVVEAGFVRAILSEPLCWMGLVDIGFGRDPSGHPTPIAYRLTPVGAQVLGVGPRVEIPEGEGKVVVQPNFEVFALDPISDLALANLDQFAERISAERAIKYHLTRESVYRAQRNGWTARRILDTLHKMSAQPGEDRPENAPPVSLPQNVERTLEEWQSLHERITIRRKASLLQAVDSQTMDRMAKNPSIHPHLVSRPGETVAIISALPSKTDELVHALQEAGYPPARTRSPEDANHPSLTIDEDGQMHFVAALPSIYLFEQIAPFTGKDEQGRTFLTQSAVQGAIEQGLGIQEILGRLQQVHLGPLPRWVEIKIRAWGHYYGNAAMETVTLVQIQDEKILVELLAEPELQGLLSAFKPSKSKVLAWVSMENIDSLREILAERGMRLKEGLKKR